MIEIEEFDNHPTIVTPELRLHFISSGEQWHHRLDITWGCLGECVAVSVEGLADRVGTERVVNPTFQELHFQRRGGVVEALLVGQAGPYYFSGVFAVSEDDEGTSVDFDLSGRCRGVPAVLASTYEVHLPRTNAIDSDTKRILWVLEDKPVRLRFAARDHPIHQTRITLIEGDDFIHARALASNPREATQQWHYRWRCWEH